MAGLARHCGDSRVASSPRAPRPPAGRPGVNGIHVYDDFIAPAACARILDELAYTLWRPSLTYLQGEDGTRRDVLSPLRVSRTAQQAWFGDELQGVLRGLERRLCRRFACERACLENWQATDYPRGGGFYYHLDSGYWDDHYAGDRVLTCLLYLTTPERGGGTHFRARGVQLQARAGRLVVWNNLFDNGDCNHGMVHSSVPLRQGRKTTLVTWLRQKPFRIEALSSSQLPSRGDP